MIRSLARTAAVRAVVGCAVAAAVLAVASLLVTPALVQAPADDAAGDGAPPTRDTRAERRAARVAVLMAEHGCWSDAAPAGAPAPTRAVVTLPDGGPRLATAEVGYGIWLDGDPGVLHGFCP